MAIDSKLFIKYNEEIIPNLQKTLGYKTKIQTPRLEKVVINMGLGKAVTDKKIITDALAELEAIAGQKPVTNFAKKSNASFKVRAGMPIGIKVTLRGQKMYDFVYKLINIGLPRIRDFRGINERSFDGRGNFSMGVEEFIIFSEIDYDKVSTMKGMDITFVTSSKDDLGAYELLKEMGMPFKNLKKEIN
jgi:large subunit ribosomal protein L5